MDPNWTRWLGINERFDYPAMWWGFEKWSSGALRRSKLSHGNALDDCSTRMGSYGYYSYRWFTLCVGFATGVIWKTEPMWDQLRQFCTDTTGSSGLAVFNWQSTTDANLMQNGRCVASLWCIISLRCIASLWCIASSHLCWYTQSLHPLSLLYPWFGVNLPKAWNYLYLRYKSCTTDNQNITH